MLGQQGHPQHPDPQHPDPQHAQPPLHPGLAAPRVPPLTQGRASACNPAPAWGSVGFAMGRRLRGGTDTGIHQLGCLNGASAQRGTRLSLLPAPCQAAGIFYSLRCASCPALPASPGMPPAILHLHIGKLSCERVSSAPLCASGPSSSLPPRWLCVCLGAYVHLCVCVGVCESPRCGRSYNLCAPVPMHGSGYTFRICMDVFEVGVGLYLPVCPLDSPESGGTGLVSWAQHPEHMQGRQRGHRLPRAPRAPRLHPPVLQIRTAPLCTLRVTHVDRREERAVLVCAGMHAQRAPCVCPQLSVSVQGCARCVYVSAVSVGVCLCLVCVCVWRWVCLCACFMHCVVLAGAMVLCAVGVCAAVVHSHASVRPGGVCRCVHEAVCVCARVCL